MMPGVHRYPAGTLLGDYLRGAAGLVLTVVPLAVLPVHPWVAAGLTGGAVVFAVFLGLTARRHRTRILVDDRGVRTEGPFGAAAVSWRDLRRLDLAYYSTRRDRSGGWMELKLSSDSGRISLESSLDGFDAVAGQAAAAAHRNGVELDPVTRDNLQALGIPVGAGGTDLRPPVRPDRSGRVDGNLAGV